MKKARFLGTSLVEWHHTVSPRQIRITIVALTHGELRMLVQPYVKILKI